MTINKDILEKAELIANATRELAEQCGATEIHITTFPDTGYVNVSIDRYLYTQISKNHDFELRESR